MKLSIKLILFLICNVAFTQTNLLDTSTWTAGTGSVSEFLVLGTDNENIREIGLTPHNSNELLWKSQPTSTSGKIGWSTDYVNIDHTKTYRYTSWIKKTNSNDGGIYLALRCKDDLDNSTGLNLDDGLVNVAPRAFQNNPPNLDEWYLLVGYMHESGYSSTTSIGGVYDTNGVKQANMKDDFKFSNTATRLKLLNYLEFSTNTNDEFLSYSPTLYEVNGQEPTIQELIDGPGGIQVSSSIDSDYADSEEAVSTGIIEISSTDLELFNEDESQEIGLHFKNLNIPSTATITNAYVQFSTDEESTGAVSLNIYAEASDNPQIWSTTNGDITSRTKTNAFVQWSPPDWNTIGERDVAQQTPDLTSIIQEIIGRPSYTSTSPINIIFSGVSGGSRVADSYTGSTGNSPKLFVTYNLPSDTQAPTTPTLSSTAQTDTSVDLSWTASTDDTTVTGYKVYKDGVLETTLGNVLTYQVTALTAATTYNFTVTALDAIGNESIVSNIVVITTNSTSVPTTNLLDTSTWVEGNGSVTGFTQYGTDEENIRELGIGPHDTNVILWKAVPNESNGTAGGWGTGYFSIDHTKTYRFTVWIKKVNSSDGYTDFKFVAPDSLGDNAYSFLNGDYHNNSSFYRGDPPGLDDWYLFVGYIHKSTYTNTNSIGGIYNKQGVKLSILSDYKFLPEALELQQRVWLAGNTNTSDSQYFYGPTLYEVNGQEPTVQELINIQPTNNPTYPTGATSLWALNNQDVYYNSGNVGIGTTTPDEKLTVKGSIHSEEVKVDLSVPAPDYVFETDYTLTPLEKLQNYIKINKHLPNIPSAKEMKTNGVELGIMNMKLLEKIEELTLYILEQESRIKKLEKEFQN